MDHRFPVAGVVVWNTIVFHGAAGDDDPRAVVRQPVHGLTAVEKDRLSEWTGGSRVQDVPVVVHHRHVRRSAVPVVLAFACGDDRCGDASTFQLRTHGGEVLLLLARIECSRRRRSASFSLLRRKDDTAQPAARAWWTRVGRRMCRPGVPPALGREPPSDCGCTRCLAHRHHRATRTARRARRAPRASARRRCAAFPSRGPP